MCFFSAQTGNIENFSEHTRLNSKVYFMCVQVAIADKLGFAWNLIRSPQKMAIAKIYSRISI